MTGSGAARGRRRDRRAHAGDTWLLSLAWHDASIVDPVWPLGFVVVAWVTRAVADGNDRPASGSSWR